MEKVENLILNLSIVLFPLFVVFSFNDNIGFPKLLLLVVIVFTLLVVKVIQLIFTNKLQVFKMTKLDTFVFLTALVYLIAGVMKGVNNWEAFFTPGTASLVILLAVFYYFVRSAAAKYIKLSIIISSLLLSLSVLLISAGFLNKMTGFNLAGNFISSSLFFLISLPLFLEQIVESKEAPRRIFFGLCSFVVAFGLILSLYQASAKKTALVLPDFNTSWQVAVDTIKVSPLFGVGPGNYLTAFEKLRPVNYNYTPLFATKFTNSRSGVLTLITETGLLGLSAFLLVLYWIVLEGFAILKLIKGGWIKDANLVKRIVLFAPLLVTTVYLFIFPGFIVPMFVFFVFLGLNFQGTKTHADVSNLGVFKYFAILMLIAPVILVTYKLIPAVEAELAFKRSYDALNKGDAKTTYDSLIRAIQLNPNIDRYHATFAQVNLLFAKNIIQKSKNPTDDERKQIAQLVQTAISEGKLTVNTNMNRADNWALLASIYTNVIPLAKESDQFAIASYNQATILDPIDPTLRISLGGVYFAEGKYAEAIDNFKAAVLLKSDLANAHYNLALAYQKNGNTDLAKQEFQATLDLLVKGSADYNAVQKELNNIGKSKTAPAATQTETITPPVETTPELKPRIDLPKEATPPATLQP